MAELESGLAATLRLFELTRDADDIFIGRSGDRRVPRLFGGQVAAQAVVAAGRTVDFAEKPLHSLHGYFLRPGRGGIPIHFAVSYLKQGKNFEARGVTASQGEEVIFSLQASFTRPEDGIEHQESEMPRGPHASDLPAPRTPREMAAALRDNPRARRWLEGPVETRSAPGEDPWSGPREGEDRSSQRRLWFRPRAEMPDDPLLHAAMFVWMSDRSLIATGARPHRFDGPRGGASLDHSVWFHSPAPFAGWHLFAMESPVAHAGRALIHGEIYREDGTRIVSVAQEGLIRRGRGRRPGRPAPGAQEPRAAAD